MIISKLRKLKIGDIADMEKMYFEFNESEHEIKSFSDCEKKLTKKLYY